MLGQLFFLKRVSCELLTNYCTSLMAEHKPSKWIEAATSVTVQHAIEFIQENASHYMTWP
jgi:hypothetical protein